MENTKDLLGFFRGKRILLTGHTGFKGAWLSELLLYAGAEVTGYALPAPSGGIFQALCLEERMTSVIGDVRDLAHLRQVFQACRPEIVFHLAAQPLVRESYRDPVGTYSTNVMGTVHLLECVRTCDGVRSIVNVTTDKVYRNEERFQGYRECEVLDGYDPYSNSKSCSELVTGTYVRSFLAERGAAVSTARAGNVIGGGDTAADRILPDCIRAARRGEAIFVRNPHSVRPYQHVLEPLAAYLLIAKEQFCAPEKAGAYNVGPSMEDCLTTGALADLFCRFWGDGSRWTTTPDGGPHEAARLTLDCAKIAEELSWVPRWSANTAVEKTVEWTKAVLAGQEAGAVTRGQIKDYFDARPALQEQQYG
ncbi:MAG: CDP-glucose 4,6-dehydratase [Oscillibacter sp.]|jgi:CDP-glucose 4,6-dehydratase|nr:CDP-glucose 4,6-dehydratase [Oscillibacter sp.]